MGFCRFDKLSENTPDEAKAVFTAYVAHLNAIEGFVKQKDPLSSIAADPLVKIAYTWLEQSLGHLRSFVRQQVKFITGLTPPEVFWGNVCRLVCERLDQDLPPNTRSDDPADSVPEEVETIMNAGWAYKLKNLGDGPSGVGNVEEFQRAHDTLNRLVLRGIELARIKKQYPKGI